MNKFYLMKKNRQYANKKALGFSIAVLFSTLMVLTAMMPGNDIQSSKDIVVNPITSANPARVNLGTAENYAILSKAGISATVGTLITGDIGASPVAATYITGFGLIMDSSNTFSTSTLVIGKIYAASYTAPTPAVMTTAIGDMEAAYTEAAGRPDPDVTELNSGNIGGLDLGPGLYKWTSAVTLTESLILTGNSTDVWIFQISGTLGTASDVNIILNGSIDEDNIFWQVALEVTIGQDSIFYGNVLCLKEIIVNDGATVNGRLLSQTEVTLAANKVVMPTPDEVPPTVISTVPMNNTTEAFINSAITATFSEEMDASTITDTSFTLMDGLTSIDGIVSYNGLVATFTPTSLLDPSTEFKATITTGAKDLAQNAMEADYEWNFTTGLGGDVTPPTVILVAPSNNTTQVDTKIKINATFSETMNPLSINSTSFTIKNGTSTVLGTISYAGVIGTFTPNSVLAYNTEYTATITTEVMDLAGNAMEENYIWNFTTAPDTIPPTVLSTIPIANRIDVNVSRVITATFSEIMDASTINTTTFILMQGSSPVVGVVSYSNLIANFTPTTALEPETTYTATITNEVADLAGNKMLVDKVWSFTTTIAPTVISTNPANNTTDINVNSVITATFSEGMNPLTVNSTTFILMQGITPVLGVVNYLDSVATFTPSASLELETSYTATITTGVTDIAGNMMVSNKVWTFTTSPIPDTTAPTIISVIPADSSTQISVTTKINATFSEEMKTQTINSTSFTLKQGTTPVSGIVSYTNLVACFTPSSNLAPNTVYTATILSTVQDVSGNTMVSNKVWTFTTSPVPDTTAPTVIQVTPENLAKNVSLATLISVTFSEEMDPLTITNTTFIVMQGATVVEGTFTYSEGTVVFTPTNPLKPNSIYSVNITTGVKDLAGNAMESDYIWVFTTGTDLDSRIPGFPLMITLLVGIGSIGLIAFSMKKKFD